MQKEEIERLIDRYNQGVCTDEEIAFLESWYAQWNGNLPLGLSELELGADLMVIKAKVMMSENLDVPVRKYKLWPRIAGASRGKLVTSLIAAAAAVVLVVLGVYFFNAPTRHLEDTRDLLTSANDIAPGKNGATITLANGKVIQLSEAKTGVVIGEDKLAYNDGSSILSSRANAKDLDSSELGMTNLKEIALVAKTTKGQTYIFTLPDGTKVWLNAASTLKFPSGFYKDTRTVELAGEGYFEVARDSKHPFIVICNGQEVKVLGTHFNVNAYDDEGSIKTTLLEGSVKVASLSSRANAKDLNAIILKPNQQSTITGSDRITVKQVDPESAIAWKNGGFIFNEESLSSIMRQIERWYNVEVDYSTVPETRYYGAISRNVKLSKVLEMLEQTGNLKLRMENNIIKVYK